MNLRNHLPPGDSFLLWIELKKKTCNYSAKCPGRSCESDLRAGDVNFCGNIYLRAPDGDAKAIIGRGIFLPLIHAGKAAFLPELGALGILTPLLVNS